MILSWVLTINLWDFNMARRLILGKKGSDYGLFISEPGTDVASITNVKDFSFTTSDSGYKGNFL